MILVNSDWDRIIDFEEARVNTLLIENTGYFRYVVGDFIAQVDGNDGKFSLSSDNKSIDISKKVLVLSDIFDLATGINKSNNKINQYVKILSIDYLEKSKKIASDIERYIDGLLENTDLPIVRTGGISIDNILKVANLKVECGEDIIENIINIFDVCSALLGTKLFVFINIHSMMSDEEWKCFIRTIVMKECNVLVFESKMPRNRILDNNIERLYIIDEGLCEI